MESPTRRGRVLARGSIAAVATGAGWAILSAALDLHLGLLVVAAFGGWLIGSAVKPIGSQAKRWAVGLAALAALLGIVGDFVLSQLLLPAASTPIADRLTVGAFLDYLGGTFDIVAALAIALLFVVAWRSAR
jgi:hypothetical protein